MDLFIQIRNGQPYEHPIADWNFYDAFPHIDYNNLPPEFARFERVPYCDVPVGVYEVPVLSYQWVGPIVKDVWDTRPMNTEEKLAKDIELANIAKILADEEAAKSYFESLDNKGAAPNVIG